MLHTPNLEMSDRDQVPSTLMYSVVPHGFKKCKSNFRYQGFS